MAPKAPLGIALSGGADSTALALIAARALGAEALRAATVDHRLRPESREEAEVAGRIAASLGIPHEILTWQEAHQDRAPTGEGGGNLQARARMARQGLLTDWARAHRLSAVLLGHTMDDQAETVLMRLERGSGADGLAGMAARVEIGGMVWLRPLLDLRRADLRDLLRAEGLDWTEDPSNQDPG
ncbi:MAG: tRNA lysidine(34) synthetase TilS, partial [Pseudomonadota bacterium]